MDQSQSVNVFFKGTSGKDLSDVYMLAWELGLKTTYYLRTLGASQVEKSTVSTSEFGATHTRSSDKKITEISKGVSFIKLINGNELIDLFKSSDLYNEVFKIEDSQKISAIYKAVVPNKINKELIWNEQIGNFTFKELYQILSNQKLQIRTQSMIWRDQLPPDEDLLTLFRTYCLLFNIGVDMEESLSDTRYSGYTFGILAPKLIGYGLLEKIEIKSFEIDYIDIKYQTSEVGHRFFALLEKVIHLSSSPNVEDM